MNWSSAATLPFVIPDQLVGMIWVFIVLGTALALTLFGAALFALRTIGDHAEPQDPPLAERAKKSGRSHPRIDEVRTRRSAC